MKIILSRKGFDSGYGGVASPILPDGSMFSLPIPTRKSPVRYKDISCPCGNLGKTVTTLTGRRFDNIPAHLDPDLDYNALHRPDNWKPVFGQEKAAAKHLANQGVGVGDLFLFFGWFKHYELNEEGYPSKPNSKDLHVLFGYLQVGRIIPVGSELEKHRIENPHIAQHPHLHSHNGPNNIIYEASDSLTLFGNRTTLPGAGTFPQFRSELVLTQDGFTRSVWKVPAFFYCNLTYHNSQDRWTDLNDGTFRLRSVAKGQEFVCDIREHKESASSWLKHIFGL